MLNNSDISIIGITGKALSGKDTIASLIIDRCATQQYENDPYSAHAFRFAFADKLKQETADALGVPISYCYEQPFKEAIRPLLQVWGDMRKTELLNGHKLYWCVPLNEKVLEAVAIAESSGAPSLVIVTDIRYDFEADYVRKLVKDSAILEIQGTNTDTTAHNAHSSEAGVSPHLIDYTFYNDKALGIEHAKSCISEILLTLSMSVEQRETKTS